MTLKQYLEENNIKATPDERSRIGRAISSKNDSYGLVKEGLNSVKDYKYEFLNNPKTQLTIIKVLNQKTS